MINFDATSELTAARRARVEAFGDALQGFTEHVTTREDDSHEMPRDPLAAPRPTLGAAPPVASPRPPVGRIRAYFPAHGISSSGGPTPPPVATFQQAAIGHTPTAVVNGRTVLIGSVL
ncbi:hypothetical protein [Streptosporangium pseudovulgare]|uniref:Uncharacterized protein n=1 Tax=Streptosporangium pseudovulgare TaxID=35765 RepID=A0ABQ2R6I7_9ACTN|nr:hypothetical protein [Streptosporangium pseudovulgare]GGQ11311.1 hypothetical protein GCM10010140_46830 [Streptosporangium pseudovulgare]